MMMYKGYFTSQIGIICVHDNGESCFRSVYVKMKKNSNMSDLTVKAINQIKEYLGGVRKKL